MEPGWLYLVPQEERPQEEEEEEVVLEKKLKKKVEGPDLHHQERPGLTVQGVVAGVLQPLQSLFLAGEPQVYSTAEWSLQTCVLVEQGMHHHWHEPRLQQPGVPSSFCSALLQGWS